MGSSPNCQLRLEAQIMSPVTLSRFPMCEAPDPIHNLIQSTNERAHFTQGDWTGEEVGPPVSTVRNSYTEVHNHGGKQTARWPC
jgi:hypothetical protein